MQIKYAEFSRADEQFIQAALRLLNDPDADPKEKARFCAIALI